MKSITRLAFVLPFLIAVALVGAAREASAQATRTWVSGVGDDANPCSRTAPCKTFAGTISKTAARGEINCLDPGGFGAVTITKSITILCTNTVGGILAAGTTGVIVNVLSTDSVVLDGLDIEGFGTGIAGVRMSGAGKLTIRNTVIRNFSQFGVNMAGSQNARLLMDNVTVLRSTVGLALQGSAAGVQNFGIVRDSLLDSNQTQGVLADNGAFLLFDTTMITGSPTSGTTANGATIATNGNNVFRPNIAGTVLQQLN